MKYCLLLCGMLMSFMGFTQNITGGLGSAAELNNLNESNTFLSKSADSSLNTAPDDAVSKTVYATYYAKKFEGRKTTSGVRYRRSKMTAAHMTLPFGTMVTVTNPATGKSVEVEVNDRGPHSKKFEIDLSEAAAKELGFYKKGVAKVEISYIPDAE